MTKILATALSGAALAAGVVGIAGPAVAASSDLPTPPPIPRMTLSHGYGFDSILNVEQDGSWNTFTPGPADEPIHTDSGQLSYRQRDEIAGWADMRLSAEANEAAKRGYPVAAGCQRVYELRFRPVGALIDQQLKGCFDPGKLDSRLPIFNGTVKILLKGTTYR
jgi:hypothetical protein